jgi:lactoylglutathione lyase
MRIDHVAIWVKDLETMKWFYESFFAGKAGDSYENLKKGF